MSKARFWLLGVACVGLATTTTIEAVRIRAIEHKTSALAHADLTRQVVCFHLRSLLEQLPATRFPFAKSSDAQVLVIDEYSVLTSRALLEPCGVDYAPLEDVIHYSGACDVMNGDFSCATRAVNRVLDAYPRLEQLPSD